MAKKKQDLRVAPPSSEDQRASDNNLREADDISKPYILRVVDGNVGGRTWGGRRNMYRELLTELHLHLNAA